jgi:hypothetical protein
MDRKSAVLMAMGFELIGLVAAFYFIGKWLDMKYGWGPLGGAFGAILGVVAWVIHLMVVAREASDDLDSGGKPQK